MDTVQIAAVSAINLLVGFGLSKLYQCQRGQPSSNNIKSNVKNLYSKVVTNKKPFKFGFSCCGDKSSSNPTNEIKELYGNIMCDSYECVSGYMKEADHGLGCGIPTQFADIKKGDIVLDLGSGAGVDCFVAREITGPEGKVIGLDFTEEMIKKAQSNSDNKGYRNVEFRQGDIEDMPIIDNYVDVIISNCVINLCPDKKQAYKEIFRVLKQGGHFSISDIVIDGHLPQKFREAAEVISACVGGAMNINEQIQLVKDLGFVNVQIKKQKTIEVPDELIVKFVGQKGLEELKQYNTKILSITLYAEKDQKTQRNQ